MNRRLFAERYLTERARRWKLDDFVLNDLHGLDLEETLDFYAKFHAWTRDPQDRGFLAANDRFYLFTQLLNRKDGIHPWLFDRCREVEAEPDGCLDLWARYHYKAERVQELVPTPRGWKRHGDLKPGDYVFGPDGRTTEVVARTPVFTDADCYRVTFDKGFETVVSGDHLWTVEVHSRSRMVNSREKRRTVTINTRELMAEVELAQRTKSRVLPSVPVTEALRMRPTNQLIPPYILGVWLGDGDSTGPVICGQDREVFEEIEKLGYRLAPHRHMKGRSCDFRRSTIYGMGAALKKLGLLRNKHIPKQYEFASIEQRVAILQGLMDTDGHCDTRGTATFVNANERLARSVFRIAAGLGLKPSLRQHIGTYKGEPYPFWHVSFQVRAEFPVFRIQRKQVRGCTGPSTRSSRHAIVSIEPVASEPCSCIQVMRPDGLYLVGEHCIPTHNSSINTFAGSIQEIIRDPEITICIFSYTKPIAAKFLSQIKKELERNDDLKMACKDVFWFNPRRDAPSWSLGGGITVIRTSNPKEATIEAHGLDAQPTSKHFKLLNYDDVVVKQSVTNATQIAKTTENWELSDNLGVGEATRKWMQGTRYDLADTYAEIIERKIAKVRLYPATHNGKLTGRPVFLSEAHWDKIKKTQRKTVAAQMLQNPAEGSETYFDMAWLKGYEVRPSRVNIYILVDPASSKKKDSDRTAMAVIAVDERKNKYLVDGFCHRMSALERWKNLKMLHQKWNAMPGVETLAVGYERYGAQSDIEWMQERMADKNDAYAFAIKELNTTIDGEQRKEDRISRLQPDIEGSEYRFYFPAVVWRPNQGTDSAGGMVFWSYNADKGDFVYRPAERLSIAGHNPDGSERYLWTGEPLLTKAQKGMIAMGEPHRNAKPIVRKDENNSLYDLTMVLFEEMRYFPKRKGHDDLMDATSRLYDMEYVGPVSSRESERIDNTSPAH